MDFLSFDAATVVGMLSGSLALMEVGRWLGRRRVLEEGGTAMAGLNAIEGATFALLGLLVAFTLSGALQRFDDLRSLIVKEANAISTTYDRLGTLDEAGRIEVRGKLKAYLGERLTLYKLPMSFSIVDNMSVYDAGQLAKIEDIRTQVWDAAVIACARAPTTTPCNLILPSLNEAFEVARERAGANERHPPRIVYLMLLGLGLGGSMLAGFGMAASRRRSVLHMVVFCIAMSVALFVITDMEFPRQGLITTAYFDKFLEQVLSNMK